MKTNMKSWGIFEKLVQNKEPIFYPTFLQRMPFAQILRQRKSLLLLVVFRLTPKCGNDIKSKPL